MYYYHDINLKNVMSRFFWPREKHEFFTTESNSLEFIRYGKLQLLRKQDGKIIDLTAPAFFWMKVDEEYCFAAEDQNRQGKYIEHIYLDFLGERSTRMIAALEELYPAGMFHPRNPEEVCNVFFHILRLYRSDPVSKLPEIGLLIEKLMYMAYDTVQMGDSGKRDAYGLEKIAEKLRSEPFQEYDFRKMAAELDLSMDHFRRLFRERHQLPPQSYLYHQRMIRATELLEKTDMRIKEIVFSCHFKSGVDFSRKFKKYSGLSPRAYRYRKNK